MTLEFDKVLARLADLTAFSAGREAALALRPAASRTEAAQRQALGAEARRLRAGRPNLGLAGAHDVRPHAEKAALHGVLEPAELLEIHSTLVAVRTLRGNIGRLAQQYPLLADLTRRMYDPARLVNEIVRCISPRGEIADTASPALAAVRREARIVHDRLQGRLQEILTNAVARGVAQEALITERDGRYVIPIKADFRGQLRGIVHDVSGSGATLWVEPLGVVDLGNQYRELRLEEQREAQRVLRQLSELVADVSGQIETNVELLAELDVVLAAARLGELLKAHDLPQEGETQSWLVDAPAELRLLQARHPLLQGEIVPITLYAGGAFRVLMITGPNTGGKTVALKTAGLLALMALAGLPIPASEGSSVPAFDAIYADIGDEQSIEQSLSTFSSHMRNIVGVLERAGPRSLVLLDELGAGTDPEEGAALARAIVQRLLQQGCTVIATTHHGELKVFAHETPGVMNASVEFDAETLAPTYRLAVGLPGRSNAIAIAARLGMPRDVLEQARQAAGPEQERVGDLLADLQRERDRASAARLAVEQAAAEAEALRSRYAGELAELDLERAALRDAARSEAEQELASLRTEMRETSRRLQRAVRTERPAAAAAAATAADLAEAEATATEVRARLDHLRGREPERRQPPPAAPAAIRPGDRVTVRGLDQTGEALSAPDDRGEFDIQLGALRMRIKQDQVERVAQAAAASASRPIPITLPPRPDSPGLELEVRGHRAEEAIPRIEEYLQSAYLAGLPFVRIIHGKGTGALRRVVREALASSPLVSDFEPAESRAGGEGVTIAHLAV
ncbi:MAG TPA: endonuclease MutS2 [Dehalococcoidia bacterium]|nr:endonuclease MutS2 [Dehalococcoidia bacterium]